jgi:hypothetical protein
MTEFNSGDKVMYGDRVAELLKPMSPSGLAQGQLWEIRFEQLPCTVYRWIKPDSQLVVDNLDKILFGPPHYPKNRRMTDEELREYAKKKTKQ